MPAIAEAAQATNEIERKRWTRHECDALMAAGIEELDRYELIVGELIRKVPKSKIHSLVILLLSEWLRLVFGARFVVQEASVEMQLGDAETSIPEPDLVVLRRSFTEIPGRPSASDLLLTIEVSGSTLNFDRTIKADLYARAGIQEYWIVDLERRRLIVHREPTAGRYQQVLSYSEDEFVSPLAAPLAALAIRNCFQPSN